MPTNPANDILVRATMEASTGLVEDRVSNDFAFRDSSGISDANLSFYAGAVAAFYQNVQVSGDSVGEYISNAVDRGATHEILVYRISATGTLNSPVLNFPWLGPPTAGTTTAVPTEVAGVLSFHADLTGILEESGATRPRARRRGRIYIPCLTVAAIQNSTPPYLLEPQFLSTLRQAAVELADFVTGAGDPKWSVWSREDGELRPIVAGWTDNAPDTQRRRGAGSTARTVWTV